MSTRCVLKIPEVDDQDPENVLFQILFLYILFVLFYFYLI